MAYTITGRKTGTVRFMHDDTGNIQTESLSMTSKVTSNPIESGSDINDHVANNALKFNVSGTIIGGDTAVAALKRMRQERDIITYVGRSRAENLVITSLSFDYNAKNKNGCTFKAQFQEVQITSAEKVEVPMMTTQDTGKSSSSQTKKTTNSGTQTIVHQTISTSSYASYVNSYNGGSSSGPTTRSSTSYSGLTQ